MFQRMFNTHVFMNSTSMPTIDDINLNPFSILDVFLSFFLSLSLSFSHSLSLSLSLFLSTPLQSLSLSIRQGCYKQLPANMSNSYKTSAYKCGLPHVFAALSVQQLLRSALLQNVMKRDISMTRLRACLQIYNKRQ
jgi:hypothetical protein